VLRKLLITTLAAGAGAGLSALPSASGSAPASAASSSSSASQVLTIDVTVGRISARGRAAKATGVATATLAGVNGAVTSVKQKITLSAATGGNCRILHLFLQKLDLTLLGLNVHLDKVNLDITGKKSGGILGKLFCSLAGAKGKLARVRTARAINARLSRHPMRALKTRAHITPQATASQAATTCQVLDLVVGPLNLQLLGLVVDLNQVHLTITATRGGGVLGDLFCGLADQKPATTTQ
jgi:hypothetical protein